MNYDGSINQKNLSFNFTLNTYNFYKGQDKLLFEFKNLNIYGFIKGELEFVVI